MKKRAKNTKLGKLLSLALALMLAASLLPANGLKAKAAAPTLSVGENVIFTGSENINDWSSRWEIPVSDWSVVPAGSQLVITADMLAPEVAIEDYAVFHILNSSWEKVGSLHDLGWNYSGGTGGVQTKVITLSASDIEDAVANGGLGIQGVSWVVKKVSLVIYPDYAGTTVFTGSHDVNAWGERWNVDGVDWSSVAPGSMLVVTAEMIPGVGYAEFKVLDAEWSDITGIDKQTWNYAQGGSQKLLIPLSAASLNQAVEKLGLGFQGVGFTVKKLELFAPPAPAHTHGSWVYSVESTSKLVATCGNSGCTSPAKKLTLTISASATNYNGTAATITIGTAAEKTAWTEAGLTVPTTIEYYNGASKLTAAPTATGSYTAKVTAGTATASVSYTIVPTQAELDQAAADEVIEKITAIGTVEYTDASKTKIEAARSAFDALTTAQKALVTNAATLTAAESSYAELKAAADAAAAEAAANQAAADTVIAKIDAIGTVEYTDASKAKIEAARTAFDALTDTQKALVTNTSALTAAESSYAELKTAAEIAAANQAAADVVIAKIDAIGTVEYTDAFKEKVDAAKEAYEALTDVQKALVTNASTIAAAEAAYATLKEAFEQDAAAAAANLAAANAVIEKIDAIGTVEYTDESLEKINAAKEALAALTDVQKALVTNTDKITNAETTYENLKAAAEKAAADEAAANAVIEKIDAIGTVEYTDASLEKINAAKEALAALTEDQKALVTNAEKIADAEKTYAELKAAAEKAAEEAAKKAADEAAAKEVIDAIDEIGTVEYTDACKTKIEAAATAYAALTADQKALVSNYTVYTTAASTYAALKAEADANAALPPTGDSAIIIFVLALTLVLASLVLTLRVRADR